MTARRRIAAVTGSRADYGLLTPLLRLMVADPTIELQVIATGQHLADGGAAIAARTSQDNVPLTATVDLHLTGDDAMSVTAAAGRALEGLAPVLARLQPDWLILLGDRYEILCAALAATFARIPIAHIAGGDVTEGAFDDAFRHAITKMAHLHFVTSEDAARRVRQLGEASERVHAVGSPGIDLIRTTPTLTREAFFAAVGLAPRTSNLLITFHPVTLADDSLRQLESMLEALATFDAGLLFTGSNADPEGRAIDARVGRFVADHPAARFVASLGTERYFSALRHMDAIVGNSSSGLYEAPSFGIPTVNIGDRQKGRLRASSVIDCTPDAGVIGDAISTALARGRCETANPYGDGHAAERIVSLMKSVPAPRALLAKRFVDLEAA